MSLQNTRISLKEDRWSTITSTRYGLPFGYTPWRNHHWMVAWYIQQKELHSRLSWYSCYSVPSGIFIFCADMGLAHLSKHIPVERSYLYSPPAISCVVSCVGWKLFAAAFLGHQHNVICIYADTFNGLRHKTRTMGNIFWCEHLVSFSSSTAYT